MQKEGNKIFVTVLATFICTAQEISVFFEPLKYLKYLGIVPLIFASHQLFKNNFKIQNYNLLAPFFIIIVSTIFHIYNINIYGIYSVVFTLAAISIFLYNGEPKLYLKFVNVSSFIVFLLSLSGELILDFTLETFFKSDTSTGESNMLSFIFGLFAIFYLLRKDYLWAILNFAFVILSFKRVVLLGLIFSLIAMLLPSRFKRFIFRPSFFILINISYVAISILFGSGYFDHIIAEITGLPVNYATKGRYSYMLMVLPFILNNFILVSIWGIGNGGLLMLMNSQWLRWDLFHNDILKFYVEHGVIFFIIFFYYLYKHKSHSLIIMTIYLNSLLTTDNVLIYTPVLFMYFLLLTQLKEINVPSK